MITPVTLAKSKVAAKASAVSELANAAMKDFGGITVGKAKKVMPKALEADTIVIGKGENKVNMCSLSSYFDFCTAGLSV